MLTEMTITNKIQVTPKQLLELKTIKHWVIENIKDYEKCMITGSSIKNGVLNQQYLIAIFVNCNQDEAVVEKHKIYQFNAEHNHNYMLRLVICGQEDCFSDLIGGIDL